MKMMKEKASNGSVDPRIDESTVAASDDSNERVIDIGFFKIRREAD